MSKERRGLSLFWIIVGVLLITWGVSEIFNLPWWPLMLIAIGVVIIVAGVLSRRYTIFEEKKH
ncbi:MAG: hypothetical protein DRJ68_02750 [Thermoprotei archaeon]|nr:MAG: hypothetical protein DRJ62_00695 [Thermoprotei archaeon]RLF21752.1 MAG: hypothetical protein DRJ68_02750 [Thermoprotei archaeon]